MCSVVQFFRHIVEIVAHQLYCHLLVLVVQQGFQEIILRFKLPIGNEFEVSFIFPCLLVLLLQVIQQVDVGEVLGQITSWDVALVSVVLPDVPKDFKAAGFKTFFDEVFLRDHIVVLQ